MCGFCGSECLESLSLRLKPVTVALNAKHDDENASDIYVYYFKTPFC